MLLLMGHSAVSNQNRPDPAILELARIIARQLARDHYDDERARENAVSSDKVNVNVKLKFRADTLVRGRYTFIIPFDEGCAELIGEIVIYWGAFEVRMDALMAHIFDISGKRPNPKWRKQPFGDAKSYFVR